MEIDKPILNFGWKLKGPRLSKTILEKNKAQSLLTPCHICISGVSACGCVFWKHWKIVDMMFAPRYFNKHLLRRAAYLHIMPLLIYFFIMPLLHRRKWTRTPWRSVPVQIPQIVPQVFSQFFFSNQGSLKFHSAWGDVTSFNWEHFPSWFCFKMILNIPHFLFVWQFLGGVSAWLFLFPALPVDREWGLKAQFDLGETFWQEHLPGDAVYFRGHHTRRLRVQLPYYLISFA